MASLALVLWAALEHPDRYPFIIMLADTRGRASINAASVQHELRNNDLLLREYDGHLKYKRIDDPRSEPTLESDEDWQAMNCVLDNGVRILSCPRERPHRGRQCELSGSRRKIKEREAAPASPSEQCLATKSAPRRRGTWREDRRTGNWAHR
jgi:hypothetical protein